MSNLAQVKSKIVDSLRQAKKHLEYSSAKVSKISLAGELDEKSLESLESFSSRFARYSDLLVSRYFRTLVLQTDPGFRGTVIDLLNQAEKQGWIASAAQWKRIRELRNVAAHEYEAEDYKKLYEELRSLAPLLLAVSLDL